MGYPAIFYVTENSVYIYNISMQIYYFLNSLYKMWIRYVLIFSGWSKIPNRPWHVLVRKMT